MGNLVITDENFEEEVLKHKGLVMVDFWAVWCYPCQMLGPVIEEIAEEKKDKVKVVKVDVDACPLTSQKYGIQSIPTIMFFKDGNLVNTLSAVRPKGEYLDAIEKYSK